MRKFLVVFMVLLLVASLPVSAAQPGAEQVQVIVGFRSEAGPETVQALGGSIERDFGFINAALVTIPAKAVDRLSSAKGIRYVEPDYEAEALGQTVPWGIERVNALEVHAKGEYGGGIKVAILDTGIMLTHEDLTVYGGYDTYGNNNYNDYHGHGTHVAGTVAALNNNVGVIGAAPQARLYAVKVLSDSGSGAYSNIIAGIEWSINNGMQVINMSLGGRSGSQALEDACNAAYNAGLLIVAAAGNEGNIPGNRDTIGYPARYESVMAVGSTTQTNTRSTFSSTGPALEIMAPGQSILSTTNNGGYGSMSGTSMASPHVAGVAALIWAAEGTLSNTQLRDALNETANDMWNDPYRYGSGLVDAWAAYVHITGNGSGPGDPGDPDDPAPEAITADITTDKAVYNLRNTIYITVSVVDEIGEAVSGAEVNLEVVTASGSVYNYSGNTGSSGTVGFSFKTKNPDGRGEYILTATAAIGSITDTTSTTVIVQ